MSLKKVNNAIGFINENFEEFQVNQREKEREIAEIKSTMNGWNKNIDKLYRASDSQKQYFRINCLLVHCIDEENQENTDEVVINTLKKEIHEKITHQDIDRSHL